MAELLLGISVGLFMYSFVNKKWNTRPWVDSTYVFGAGVLVCAISLLLFLELI